MISKIVIPLLIIALALLATVGVWVSYDLFFVAPGAQLIDKLIEPILVAASIFGIVKLWSHIGPVTYGPLE